MTVTLGGNAVILLFLAIFFSGCGAGFQAGGDVAQGRQALFRGDYQNALSLFQSAAQTNAEYISGTELREGTLSFLGREQYLNGQLAPARDTLRKAVENICTRRIARSKDIQA